MPDLRPLIPLAALGLIYRIGLRRLWERAGPGRLVTSRQVQCFAAGLLVTAAAVASPLDRAADRFLTAHMVQHVVLLTVAGPLLALGAPLPTALWALPEGWRAAALRRWRRLATSSRGAGWYVWAATSITLTSMVMWAWHAPVLYQAALHNSAVHGLEHGSYLAVSMLQWWALAVTRRARRGAATLAVFMAAFPATALGAAMLLAPRPWYPDYVRTTVASALSDQQMAGVVMWAFGGLVYVLAAAVLFGTWLSAAPADELPVRPGPFPVAKEVT